VIDKQTIAYLRYVHGFYNTVVLILFMYQGFLGLRIREQRKTGVMALVIIKRHRKAGPFLVLLGLIGFFAGIILVFVDYGNLLKFPLHLITGMGITILIIGTFVISRRIKSSEPEWRTPHFVVGIAILCLYVIQTFLGLGILF